MKHGWIEEDGCKGGVQARDEEMCIVTENKVQMIYNSGNGAPSGGFRICKRGVPSVGEAHFAA